MKKFFSPSACLMIFLPSVAASQGTTLIIEGRHNADKGWISELRMKGHALVIKGLIVLFFFFLGNLVGIIFLIIGVAQSCSGSVSQGLDYEEETEG